MLTARVITHHRAHRLVKTREGDVIAASARTKGDAAVVGDWVECSEAGPDQLCIERIHERTSVLERQDRRGKQRVLASNFERMVIVSAPKPGVDRLLMDQYTVAAETAGVEPIVLINKSDLLSAEDTRALHADLAAYTQCGYPVLFCSARSPDTLHELQARLRGKSCVFVGQSGVGKSSLIQHFAPQHDIPVGALSRAGLGSHTTVAAFWYETPDGGAVIDSPGVREFRVDHLAEQDIRLGFRDISAFARQCKFNDCTHVHEPKCAVKAAVDSGALSQLRLNHFSTLLEIAKAGDGHT